MAASSRIRMVLVATAILLAVLLAMAGGFVVWLGSESALQWLAHQAEQRSAGRLVLRDVHGSLYGPLRIGSLSFQTETQSFEATDTQIDWVPRSLFDKHIQIARLAVQELRVIEGKPSTEAFRLPENLTLPVRLSAPKVAVERIVIQRGKAEQVLTGLDFGIDNAAAHYTLELRNIASQWGSGQATLVLGDHQPYSIAAQARLRRDTEPPYRADVAASGDLNQLLLKLNGSYGKLSLDGSLSVKGFEEYQWAGTLHGFNPADFGDYPAADIQASFSAVGELKDTTQANIEFSIADSRVGTQALTGKGKLSVSATRIWNTDVMLQLARNRLEAKGALGKSADRLDFRIEADKLASIDPQLDGTAHITGTLMGSPADLSGKFEAQLDKLSWQQYRVASLHAKGRLDKGIAGPLALDAKLQGLATPQLKIDHAAVNAQGRRGEHTISIQAKNSDFDMASRLLGGWHEGKSGDNAGDWGKWTGRVMELANLGRHAFKLKSPLPLTASAQRVQLGQASFALAGSDIVLHELDYADGKLATRGEFKNMPVAYLQKLVAQDEAVKTDLRLGGSWQIAVGDSVNGKLALWREGGDLSLIDDPRLNLGLSQLSLTLEATNNKLQARMDISGKHLGSAKAEAQSRFSLREGTWGIAGDAPAQASAELSVASLSWLPALLGKQGELGFDGALSAQLHADGNFAKPKLRGTIAGKGFSLALPDQGLHLTEGSFQADLQDSVLYLKQLAVRGGDGRISGQGQVALDSTDPHMELSLLADKLEVLARPDRHLILSGNSALSIAGKAVKIEAKLKADRGLFELPKANAPTISDDVVVLGRTKAQNKGQPKKQPYAIKFDLDMDLGENFFIKGKGLDAQVGGALQLSGAVGALPSSRGSIHVVKGTYAAYGQRLEIERGILNFQGPLDNPGLNIVAMRKNQSVEAGVAVSGTALSPSVRLVSTPTVPDSEKLSWLVLGHGIDNADGTEINALQTAAGALLASGNSVSLQQKIANATGLEEVSLKGNGGLEGSKLTLGKRLSSRAYLSYEQGLAGAGTLVKINYTLSKRLSVRAQAGATPAVDLFYTFSYD